MPPEINQDAHAHNLKQMNYFEANTKKTMIPKDTPYLRRHISEILRFIRYIEGERVLEIGCGMGRYTIILAKQGVRVTGVDLSPVLLERLRDYNTSDYDIPLIPGNVENLPIEFRSKFDIVLGFFTLHHIFNLEKAFSGIKACLKPGGRIIFLEPNPLCLLYYLQIAMTPGMTWKGEKGMLNIRPKNIANLMGEVGFIGFEYKRFGFLPPVLFNRSWGTAVESVIERIPLIESYKPFQMFKGHLPLS